MYRRYRCREACLRFFIYVLVKILFNVENLLRKNDLNLPFFCHKITTSPKIKNLRHPCIVMFSLCPENFIHLYEILRCVSRKE